MPDPGHAVAVRGPTLLTVTAGVATALFVATSLFAPPSTPPCPASLDAPLLERVFPRVDPAWVTARLVLAFVSTAAWLAATARRPVPGLPETTEAQQRGPARARRLFAATMAVLVAFAAAFAPERGPVAEGALVLSLFAAPLALWQPPPRRASWSRWQWATLLAVFAWLAWRAVLPPAPRRSMDLVDAWLALDRVRAVAAGEVRLLGDAFLPGATNAYMTLEGIPVFAALGRSPDVEALRWIHGAWAAVAAVAVASVVRRHAGGGAGLFAAVSLLCSPFLLHTMDSPLPIFLGPAFAAALVWLLDRGVLAGSGWALAMAGPVSGLAATVPALVPLAGLSFATALGAALLRLRRGAIEAAVVVCLVSGFAAAFAPSVPAPRTVANMASAYTTGAASWGALERILHGQMRPDATQGALAAGRSRAVDVPLGAILSPWMIARTPMRALGDGLQDPWSIVLFGVGLAAAFATAGRSPVSRWLLLGLAVTLLPGVLSSYDRPSHTRMFAAPVFFCLLASIGLARTTAALTARAASIATVALAALCATTGFLLYDVVDARRLERSFFSIAIEAVAGAGLRATMVETSDPATWEWLHYRRVWENFGPPGLSLATPSEALADLGRDGDAMLLVAPGLEAMEAPIAGACRIAPSGRVAVLHDPSGYSRAFVFAAGPSSRDALDSLATSTLACAQWPVGGPPPPSCQEPGR